MRVPIVEHYNLAVKRHNHVWIGRMQRACTQFFSIDWILKNIPQPDPRRNIARPKPKASAYTDPEECRDFRLKEQPTLQIVQADEGRCAPREESRLVNPSKSADETRKEDYGLDNPSTSRHQGERSTNKSSVRGEGRPTERKYRTHRGATYRPPSTRIDTKIYRGSTYRPQSKKQYRRRRSPSYEERSTEEIRTQYFYKQEHIPPKKARLTLPTRELIIRAVPEQRRVELGKRRYGDISTGSSVLERRESASDIWKHQDFSTGSAVLGSETASSGRGSMCPLADCGHKSKKLKWHVYYHLPDVFKITGGLSRVEECQVDNARLKGLKFLAQRIIGMRASLKDLLAFVNANFRPEIKLGLSDEIVDAIARLHERMDEEPLRRVTMSPLNSVGCLIHWRVMAFLFDNLSLEERVDFETASEPVGLEEAREMDQTTSPQELESCQDVSEFDEFSSDDAKEEQFMARLIEKLRQARSGKFGIDQKRPPKATPELATNTEDEGEYAIPEEVENPGPSRKENRSLAVSSEVGEEGGRLDCCPKK